MSEPAPFTVNTPLANDAEPGTPTAPMSWFIHGVGKAAAFNNDVAASVSTHAHVAHMPRGAAFLIVVHLKTELLGRSTCDADQQSLSQSRCRRGARGFF